MQGTNNNEFDDLKSINEMGFSSVVQLLNIIDDNNATTQEKDYALKHAHWSAEKQIKNKMIRTKPKQETVQRRRARVYWCSLGMNVGSELCEDHFSVVIKEYAKTAIIIPLSSQKENVVKSEDDGYFDIGFVNDLPIADRKNYAVISQMKTVSKKRLSDYRLRSGKYLQLKLTDQQMDIIDRAIKEHLTII